MENIQQPEKTKEQKLLEIIKSKYIEIGVVIDEMSELLDEIESIAENAGKLSAKVMADVKYNDELGELIEKEKGLLKEVQYLLPRVSSGSSTIQKSLCPSLSIIPKPARLFSG